MLRTIEEQWKWRQHGEYRSEWWFPSKNRLFQISPKNLHTKFSTSPRTDKQIPKIECFIFVWEWTLNNEYLHNKDSNMKIHSQSEKLRNKHASRVSLFHQVKSIKLGRKIGMNWVLAKQYYKKSRELFNSSEIISKQ